MDIVCFTKSCSYLNYCVSPHGKKCPPNDLEHIGRSLPDQIITAVEVRVRAKIGGILWITRGSSRPHFEAILIWPTYRWFEIWSTVDLWRNKSLLEEFRPRARAGLCTLMSNSPSKAVWPLSHSASTRPTPEITHLTFHILFTLCLFKHTTPLNLNYNST